MFYNKIMPYYISLELKEKGWESDETGVYIPWPTLIKDKQVYLKICKHHKFFSYVGVHKTHDGTFKGFSPIYRDASINNDLNGNGAQVLLDEYDKEVVFKHEKALPANIRQIMGLNRKEVSDEEVEKILSEIVSDMKKADCLEILLNPHYYNSQYEKFQKNEYALIKQFQSRKHVGKARQRLASWLKVRFDVILRKNTHDIYILDEDNNCYTEVTLDELMYKVSEILGSQLINDDDLKWALSYISDRLDPQHNIVKFKNCIFDMDKLEVVKTDKPTFTLVETPYQYNPNAKSTILKDFLYSSLKKDTDKETEETVKGIKEVTGYLFTSGNILNLLPFLSGVSGGGKSVFANILTEIFGKNKIADLKLQEIEKNVHATSSLVNKHLNIIQDSDKSAINNNSLIKQMTGNDPLQVNPKHINPFVLPKEEVPKTIVICNNIPFFKRLEPALLERFLIIEFNVKFRGEPNENKNLLNDILDNPEEIEWFIYESIKAYKEMIKNGRDFVLRKDGDATREIIDKHQNPINYLLNKVIIDHNSNISNNTDKDKEKPLVKNADNPVYTQHLNLVLIELAKKDGIDLTLNRKGEISKKSLLSTIRYEFDLRDMYVTETYDGKRYYPDLITNDDYWIILNNISPEDVPTEIKSALKLEEQQQEAGFEEGGTTA